MKLVDSQLEKRYESLLKSDRRAAAEVAFALAVIYRKQGNQSLASRYKQESFALFKELNIQTIEDAAARFISINDILIPELIHEDVVKERLSDIP